MCARNASLFKGMLVFVIVVVVVSSFPSTCVGLVGRSIESLHACRLDIQIDWLVGRLLSSLFMQPSPSLDSPLLLLESMRYA